MKKIRLAAVLIVCLVLSGFIVSGVSGEAIPPVWCINIGGGVYHMISFPYMPEDRDPLASLVDDLGPYDRTQWRFFRYDPARSTYSELKSPGWGPEQDLDFGRGYWIISKDPTKICIEGNPTEIDWIILKHGGDGWNQIGNIFDYDFPIASLRVCPISDPSNCVQLIDPVNNTLTYVTLQEFENGSYIDIPNNGKTSLEVGKGYWLRVRSEEDVILWFMETVPGALSEEIFVGEEFSEKVAVQEGPPDPPSGLEVSFRSESGSESVSCFFATAVYRDYGHPHVQLLREFRDRYLLANRLGRIFVSMYYRWSLPFAKFVVQSKPIKALVKINLMPIVGFCAFVSKASTQGFLIVLVFPFLGSFVLLKKGVLGKREQSKKP